MQYIKVEGKDHADALKKMRQLYGSEAIIIEHGKFKNSSVMGKMFGKDQYRISAAIREKKKDLSMKQKINTLEELFDKQGSNEKKVKINIENKPQSLDKGRSAYSEQDMQALNEKIQFLKNIPAPVIKQEEDQVKSHLAYQAEQPQVSEIKADIDFIKENISKLAVNKFENKSTRELKLMEEVLKEREFSADFIEEFIKDLKRSLPQSQWAIPLRVWVKAKELLATKISTRNHLGAKKMVVFVGPTGVGKTTNIAKIAKRLNMNENRSIRLVTIDNFRIGATVQLQVYADIMGVPFSNPRNIEEFHKVEKTANEEVLIVDTFGMSQNNEEFIQKQLDFFKGYEAQLEVVLVVSAGASKKITAKIFESFAKFKPQKVLVSKVDENECWGNIIEVAHKFNLPLCHISIGQGVPEDIIEAKSDEIAQSMLEGYEKTMSF